VSVSMSVTRCVCVCRLSVRESVCLSAIVGERECVNVPARVRVTVCLCA
jgi:hypothetical protein